MKKSRIGQCCECEPGEEREIVQGWTTRNRKYCLEHKPRKRPRKKVYVPHNPKHSTPISKKLEEARKQDRELNEKIWEERPHYCENCGHYLGEKPLKFMFSHILPKVGEFRQYRHDPDNINLLCFKCHDQWGNGNKLAMKIFYKNYPYMVSHGWVPSEKEEKAWNIFREESVEKLNKR